VKTETASELEFFVLVARHGSLSAAARALDLTPPAASKRLAHMEQRLGVQLVHRTTRSISLTSEGETCGTPRASWRRLARWRTLSRPGAARRADCCG
jgi:molybdenum-dependent DNA-binding transcriptional regulator ModE